MHKVMRGELKCLIIILLTVFSSLVAADEIKVGIISERPVDMIQYYNPITQHLAGRLKSFNITGGKVVVAKDLGEMLQKVQNRAVDIVFESAFLTIEMREKTGMLPKFLVWKKGVKDYRTLFFVKKDSGIKNLNDLKGKIIALADPTSTSAYVIPKAELKLRGFTVIPLETDGPNNAIRYVFVRSGINQVFHVLQKKVDAGAFSNNDWNEASLKTKEELKIIHETKPVLRFIASFHPSLPDRLQNAMSDILIKMDKEPEGLKALQAASQTNKIERLTDADFRSLDYVKNLMEAIER